MSAVKDALTADELQPGDLVAYYAVGTHANARAGYVMSHDVRRGWVEIDAADGAGTSIVRREQVMLVHVGMTFEDVFAGRDFRIIAMHPAYVETVRVDDPGGRGRTFTWESLSRVGARWTAGQ